MDLSLFRFSPEVKQAKKDGRPILALESTIFALGLPWPYNFELGQNIYDFVKSLGVVPAVVLLEKGVVKVGVDIETLKKICKNKNVVKTAYSDLGHILGSREIGVTTVSATAHLSFLAGIEVFATGGIGGVHRNATETFDVSQDLIVMSRTPIVVVSSGAKSILDITKTVEHLETLAVQLVGYKTGVFPSFYSRGSDCKIHNRIGAPVEAADLFLSSQRLSVTSSLLVVNPVPEKDAVGRDIIEPVIEEATRGALKKNIKGKDLTPFLLESIVGILGEDCLKANMSLALNNASLGAKVAIEINKQKAF